MGDELCCSRQEANQDLQFKNPEQNILINYPTIKKNETFNGQDELNIVENTKTNNNNIDQKNTKSIIIQNDEFMYERIDTNTKINNNNNNIIYNNNIINDKDGPQDSFKITDLENNINTNIDNKQTVSDIPEDTNELNKFEDYNINKRFNYITIDTNKIVISYIPIEIKNTNKNNDIINDYQINDKDYFNNNINENENNYYNNNILIEEENNAKENNNIQINNENINQNNNIFEKINNTKVNNIQTSNIFQEKEIKPIQYDETYKITSNNNDNDLLLKLDLNSNPTFFPSNDNKNNTDSYYNNATNNMEDYTNIFNNNDTYNSSNINNNNNNYDYLFNSKESEKPLFTDKEIDEMIKQAEKEYYNTISNTNLKSTNNPTILNEQSKTIINNYEPYDNKKYNYRMTTPEKKKITYPLTPDYQIRKTKNYNDIIYYDINSNNNYGKKNNINYTNYYPITYPQKKIKKTPNYKNNQTNYNYTPIKYESPIKTTTNTNYILYFTPPKESSNVNYILSPPKYQTNQVIVHNPIKVNPPLIQYNYNNKVISKPKPIVYNTISNSHMINKYNYNVPVDSNVYRPKKIVNPPIINTTYLKTIQQMNKNNDLLLNSKNNNKYSIYSSSSSHSNLNYLNSSFSSSSSSPRKFDKKGNPIYIASLSSSKKLKDYQDSQIDKRLGKKYKSLSADDNLRKNRFDDIFSSNVSSNRSPFSAPKNNIKRNLDLNTINSLNYNNNIKYIKPNEIYAKKRTHINNINNGQTYISVFPPTYNSSTMKSIKDDSLLDLDEPTRQIIKKYSSLNMISTSNFYPDNYRLFFYSSVPNFSQIPKQEIYTNKRIKYYINDDPSKEAIYTGNVNFYNQRHGLGQLNEPHCTKIGTWKNNEFSGWGRIIYDNGQVFEGNYNNGKLSGKGIYKYKDVLYIGDFYNNRRQGKGILINKRYRYNGQFNMGKIDGYGKIIFYENREGQGEYEGFFKDNNMEGKGIMKWKNGNIYEGEMKNGKMNGTGRFIPSGGFPIEGVFRNNVKVNVK